jgi:hypothetical protein
MKDSTSHPPRPATNPHDRRHDAADLVADIHRRLQVVNDPDSAAPLLSTALEMLRRRQGIVGGKVGR